MVADRGERLYGQCELANLLCPPLPGPEGSGPGDPKRSDYTSFVIFPERKLIMRQQGLNSRQRKGFTLIVTSAVLVRLALVAVGLLTLSTLTIRSAHLGAAQSEARANAKLALMLALGDLQKAMEIMREVG